MCFAHHGRLARQIAAITALASKAMPAFRKHNVGIFEGLAQANAQACHLEL
jgi:hypothetical protein